MLISVHALFDTPLGPRWATMIQSLARRIVVMIATIFVATSAIFVTIHMAGNPVDGYLAPGASPEIREQAEHRLGLDRPILEQYGRFVWDGFRGDFGDSWRNRQPAMEAVLDRLPATLQLTGAALLLATVGGVLLGVLSATLGIGIARWFVRLFAMVGQAIPAFWLGSLLILVFAVRLGWLPSSGDESWRSLVLPTIALAAHPGSVIARLVQSSMEDTVDKPFVAVARSKGLSGGVVWVRHVLPNALIPALAYLGLQAAYLVGGSIVIESVFAYPGVGRLALQATGDRDLPVVHAFVVVVVLLVGLVNLLVDLVANLIDPRQRDVALLGVANG